MGTIVLWTIVVLFSAAVVGHVPADAAHGHGGKAADSAPAAPAPSGAGGGHHDDGQAGDLSCSIGEALCAIGIVLGIVLLRRVGTVPFRVTWPRRHADPAFARVRTAAAALRPPPPPLVVRLQI